MARHLKLDIRRTGGRVKPTPRSSHPPPALPYREVVVVRSAKLSAMAVTGSGPMEEGVVRRDLSGGLL